MRQHFPLISKEPTYIDLLSFVTWIHILFYHGDLQYAFFVGNLAYVIKDGTKLPSMKMENFLTERRLRE